MSSRSVPDALRPFWEAYCATVPGDPTTDFYEAFHFDLTEAVADELAGLVLAGTKRATASLLWMYEVEDKPLPRPGSLSILTDGRGAPLCVIETTQVDIVPYDQVTEEFARTEGEGDKSLAFWREAHWEYFSAVCADIGRNPTTTMPVVCERFEVVYRPAG